MNIRNIPTWLGLLAALYLVTACDRVYGDLSGCLGNTIVFSYLADDNREHLQEYVDDMTSSSLTSGTGPWWRNTTWRENSCFHRWRSGSRKVIIK